jgi:hypothetical protein
MCFRLLCYWYNNLHCMQHRMHDLYLCNSMHCMQCWILPCQCCLHSLHNRCCHMLSYRKLNMRIRLLDDTSRCLYVRNIRQLCCSQFINTLRNLLNGILSSFKWNVRCLWSKLQRLHIKHHMHNLCHKLYWNRLHLKRQ